MALREAQACGLPVVAGAGGGVPSIIVDGKTGWLSKPGDAAAFKAWLRQISQGVAEAASEGGFAGFGGTLVSDAEKATLSDIAKALGRTA